MPDTPDPTNPPKQTAMQVAQGALAVAESALRLGQELDENLGETIAPTVAQLRQDLTDLRGELTSSQNRHGEVSEALQGQISAVAEEMGGYVGAINRRLDGLVTSRASEGNPSMANVVARLEELERQRAKPPEIIMDTDPFLVGKLEPLSNRLRALEQAHGFPNGDAMAKHFDSRITALETMLKDAAQAVAHLPVPDDLMARLVALEAKLVNPLRFDLDGEQVGRIIERLRGLIVADLGGLPVAEPVGKVHGKVLELMLEVTEIGKAREADLGKGAGKYMFRGIDDAMDAVGHAMRRVGLTLETRTLKAEHVQNTVTSSGERGTRTVVWTTATVIYQYIFVCPEDGSRHVFEMAGEGRAADDKATSKAGSMALKYGLFQSLMIPVKGLDDSDTESPQVQQQTPARPDQPISQAPAATDQASRQERARQALAALRGVDRYPTAERLDRLEAIRRRIEEENLEGAEVDGATLRAHHAAVFRTLKPATPPPADDVPPWETS